MYAVDQVVELGSYRLKILEHLGGRKNLSFRVQDLNSKKFHILRVILKLTEEVFLGSCTDEKEEVYRKFFDDNELLKEKYGSYNRKAGYEIVSAAFHGQVILEAKILKAYLHKGISNLTFFTHDEQAYYLVLDYIEGSNLFRLLEAGHEFSDEKVIAWMREVAGVLDFLHTHEDEKLLYNNLNPFNIIIDREEKAHLVDLQKIKIYDPGLERTEEWQDVLFLDSLPPFCPMEGYVNPRSEIYALGATFYYVLTGELIPDVKDRLAHDTVAPLRELKPEYSKRLEKLIALCLELDPRNRPPGAASLMQALDNPDFGTLMIQSEGRELKGLLLGKTSRHFERAIHVTIKKPFDNAVPFKINRVDMLWKSHTDADKPSFRFADIKEINGVVEGDIIIEAHELNPGFYRGILTIESTWGDLELPVELEKLQKASPMPWIAGGLLVLLFIVIIVLWKTLTPHSRPEIYRRWNGENWPAIRIKIPSYLLPRFSINDIDKWQVYREVKGIDMKVTHSELIVSGSQSEVDRVRTGWISSFFRPVGNMSVTMSLSNAEKGCDDAGVMVLSSSGNAVSIGWSKNAPGYRIAYRTGKKWEYIDAPAGAGKPGSTSATLKIDYNKVDGTAYGYLNGKKIADVPVEFDDLGIFFFTTVGKNEKIDDMRFKIMKVDFEPPVSRMPPYLQVTKGKVAIKEKALPESKRVINTLADEKVLVREERGDWCRVSTIMEGHYEGWVKKSELRNIEPGEVMLDE
jgi:serine/threonine protein kinase